MRFLIFILLLVTCHMGCAQPRCEVDPRLRPHLNAWLRDLKAAGVSTEGRLQGLKNIGVSQAGSHAGESNRARGVVLVSEEMFERGPYSVRSTLYHELGHYAFDLEHGSCRIMAKGSYYESTYAREWDSMVTEYIKNCSKQ